MKPLLVGEDNPYGSDPRYALWCEPRNSAGGRLCYDILGLSGPKEYLRGFDRANLCSGKWNREEATKKAYEIFCETEAQPDHRVLILFGIKVGKTFAPGVTWIPFTKTTSISDGCNWTIVFLPHPSGRNRTWNEPGAIEKARAVLIEVGALPVKSLADAKSWAEAVEMLPCASNTTLRPARCENCGKVVVGKWCDDCGSYDTGWRRCTVCGKSFKGVKDADPVEKLCSPECTSAYEGSAL